MARFEITGPDGSKYEVNAPDNATEQQVMAYAQQQFAQKPRNQSQQVSQPVDPTDGMSGTDKFLAGAGKAFYDTARGAGQLLRQGLELAPSGKGKAAADKLGLPTQEEIDAAKKLDEPLMAQGPAKWGNFVGDLAVMAPSVLIPGGATIRGGSLLGAASGAIRPVATGESRTLNTAVGGVAGAALPVAGRVLRAGRAALVDPFTEAGQQRILGGALNRAASNPEQAISNMRANRGVTPGFNPTAGQAANDAGVASVERAARAADPGGFGDLESGQRAALVNALRGVASTPEARAAATEAREQATQELYDRATRATAQGDAQLDALMSRPSMRAAAEEAANLARERGQTFQLSAGAPARESASGILDASGNPIVSAIAEAPPTYSGQALHDLKMGLDTAIKDPARGFVEAKRQAAMGTRQEYLDWLERQIPEYGQARTTYADMSRPINQMDIGRELYERFVPALAESDVPFKSRADALAEALRNGDQIAQNVTGMRGATMANTMTPEQMAALRGVVSDSQMKAAAQAAGKEGGSDTVQKMAMSHLLAESGIPNWIQGAARVPGGWLRTAGDMLYSQNDNRLREMLADILRNPEATASAMEAASAPASNMQRLLRSGAQLPFLTLPTALPAAMNALEQ